MFTAVFELEFQTSGTCVLDRTRRLKIRRIFASHFQVPKFRSSIIEPAFSLSISKFKFISAPGSLLFGFEPIEKANNYEVERL